MIALSSQFGVAHQVNFPYEVEIPTDVGEGRRIQQEIIAHLKSSNFGEHDVFAVTLALEEALVNAMKHGNQLDPTKKVRIAYCIREEHFFIRIGDEGRGFDPEDVPDPTLVENLERPCGRGLMLMRHYMNEVQFLDRGSTVFMWKRRNGNE